LNLTKKLFYMPEAAAEHAGRIDQMIDIVHWLMLLLFIGWGVFFTYVLFRFRAGRNPKANYEGVKSKSSTWLEIAVAVAEAVLLIGFSIPLWAERVDELPSEEESTVVRVVGEQFAWNFHYPGADGQFGQTSIDLIDLETNPVGVDRDGAGADDIVTTTMHLPVDKPAILHLSSKDVIHSFNLPHMRSKQDTIPGMSIPMWFVPNTTTEQMREKLGDPEFQYEISCAQLCGLGHYRMRSFLTVYTAEGYQAWLDEEASYLGGDGDDFWE